MKLIRDTISMAELKELAQNGFGHMIKAVVDLKREWLAVDAELHADLETLLLEEGSSQQDLWGINLYPDLPLEQWIEFDSMINVRPSQGNRSRNVESEKTQKEIIRLVGKRVQR